MVNILKAFLIKQIKIFLSIEDGYDKDHLLNYTIKPTRDTLIKNNAMIHASSLNKKCYQPYLCMGTYRKNKLLIRNLLDGGEFFGDDNYNDENLNISTSIQSY